MRIHHTKIDELKADRSKRNKNVLYYVRHFWTVYKKNELQSWDFHIETRVVKPVLEFAWVFEVGNSGSSTPFDGHIKIFGSAIHWGVGLGRKLAQRITTSESEKYSNRSLSFRIWDKCLYLNLWTPEDRWKRGEFAKIRTACFNLSPSDRIWGTKSYQYQTRQEVGLVIDLPEGSYPVTVKLEEVTYGREKGRRQISSWSIDVDAPNGIPYRVDSSGGWKGDRVYGFGVELPAKRDDWHIDAKNLITAWIHEERGKNGFRKADPDIH